MWSTASELCLSAADVNFCVCQHEEVRDTCSQLKNTTYCLWLFLFFWPLDWKASFIDNEPLSQKSQFLVCFVWCLSLLSLFSSKLSAIFNPFRPAMNKQSRRFSPKVICFFARQLRHRGTYLILCMLISLGEKSIVAMLHLSWNLARNVKITERKLFEHIR